ncbi:porin [Flavobacterium sp.]|uniref:porin n=1 Tax=Flavobacterium sp. TaxID=239 RepID=UPI00261CF8B4|nr:porin [Flavobacterium sp.]
MKRVVFGLLILSSFFGNAQEVVNDTIKKEVSIDSLKQSLDEHTMKFGDIDERLGVIESEIAKLTKIKISGYIQAQYDMYDFQDDKGPVAGSSAAAPVSNSFFLRRARIKFTYETLEGVKFVLQPDFAFDKVSVKDAYVVLNDRWTQTYSLTVGQFNRINYEVEFSSSVREFLERTRMINTLYPNERDLGAKVEANFDTKYQFPLKLQLAAFNGNFGEGATANQVRDIDSNKDVMARIVYSLKFPSKGLGIDVGGHGYFGSTKVLPQPVTNPVTPPAVFSDTNNNSFTPEVGATLKKDWLGVETQVYYDFFGGTSLKAEYIQGTISGSTNPMETYSNFAANKIRDFRGFYISFMKNIGKSNQAIVRFDQYDPNRRLSGSDVTRVDDIKYNTWNFGWQYFYDENVKIVLGYNMPVNEKSDKVGGDYATTKGDRKDNTFSIRLQAKF